METLVHGDVKNKLLRALPPPAFALLQQHLEPVTLPVGLMIAVAGERCGWVIFPGSGFASLVGSSTRQAIGLLGSEGLACVSVVLEASRSSYSIAMLVAGNGHRISAHDLRCAMQRSDALTHVLDRYVQALMVQIAQTSLHCVCSMKERLAHLLLTASDRLAGNDIELTHETFAFMLGVMRSGVTLALAELEGDGMIRGQRKRITILDRAKLIEAAGSVGYLFVEAEYKRLIGI